MNIFYRKLFTLGILVFFSFSSSAQEELLSLMNDSSANQTVIATFKSSRLINVQTNETIGKKNLDVRIGHLFGNIYSEGGQSYHTLYGLDQSEDIRLAFQYGVSDRFMVGVSREKRFENMEAFFKYKFLQQTENDRMPVSLSVFANTTYSLQASALYERPVQRFTYFSQLILTRKFSSKLSVVGTAGFLHRNLVETNDENGSFSVGGGFRFKFTPSTSVIMDYSHLFRNDFNKLYTDAVGIGVEIETGGHVFTIMFTNANGILENDFLANTIDKWQDGEFKLSFIISRIFSLAGEKKPGN